MENKFAAIKGHRSLINREAIKTGNEARKRARLLKDVSDGVPALGTTIAEHKAKQHAAKLLSTEEN